MVKLSIGKISKDFGFALMKLGLNVAKPQLTENVYWALNSAIEDSKLSSEITQRYAILVDELSKLIQQKCKSTTVWCWDGKYYYVSLEDWKKIINKDTLDRMKWLAEYHDCDNFATQFSAYVDIFFQINSAGIAIGEVLDKNNRVIGYHAWNCLIVQENDKAEVYFYEPQGDILKKVESCIVNMDWAKYSADIIIFK